MLFGFIDMKKTSIRNAYAIIDRYWVECTPRFNTITQRFSIYILRANATIIVNDDGSYTIMKNTGTEIVHDFMEVCIRIDPFIFTEEDKEQMKKYNTKEEALEAIRSDAYNLQYVEDQTDEICLEAVKQFGLSLQFVKNKTREICLEAVKSCGHALQYVEEQDEEICKAAVEQNWMALAQVQDQTVEVCVLAVKQCHTAAKLIRNPSMSTIISVLLANHKSIECFDDDQIHQVFELALLGNKHPRMCFMEEHKHG